MHLSSERLDVQFQHVPSSSQVWGGNNSRTSIPVSTYPLTCQHGSANLTHFNLQNGVGGRDEQHEIARQHVITRSRPYKVAAVCRHRRGLGEHFRPTIYIDNTMVLCWLVAVQTPGLGRKPLMYLSCPKEHCFQDLFKWKKDNSWSKQSNNDKNSVLPPWSNDINTLHCIKTLGAGAF